MAEAEDLWHSNDVHLITTSDLLPGQKSVDGAATPIKFAHHDYKLESVPKRWYFFPRMESKIHTLVFY